MVLVHCAERGHSDGMPLVLQAVLAWFAVSVVVSPLVGTMLAVGRRPIAAGPVSPPLRTARA